MTGGNSMLRETDNMVIEHSEGYQKLRAAIIADVNSGHSEVERMRKLAFAVERAKHYEEKTGVDAGEILTAWESRRTYWYMNYYQDANQPEIDGDVVRVFNTVEDAVAAIGTDGFRCPYCKGVSSHPYACNSGERVKLMEDGNHWGRCNWKSYGLFGHLGKGVSVFVKDKIILDTMFMPVAWEKPGEPSEADFQAKPAM